MRWRRRSRTSTGGASGSSIRIAPSWWRSFPSRLSDTRRRLPPLPAAAPKAAPKPVATIAIHVGGAAHQAPAFERSQLPAGFAIEGPALIIENGATTLVEPHWRAELNAHGDLILTRLGRIAAQAIGTKADPVLLEMFNNRFMGVAEEMGLALQTTAASVNIKERLDFSCAVFDGAGGLVANAPHIPVHLGSMGDIVREILRRRQPTDAAYAPATSTC